MLFNSTAFLIFFPTVVVIYYLLPHRFRRFFLLAASLYFYMYFKPIYILILAGNTLADYVGALLITRFKDNIRLKRLFLILPILVNIGFLVYFKYLYFIADSISFFGTRMGFDPIILPTIILPIGISFHTFQSMGYLIDVFKGKIAAQRNIITFSVFVFFFPQLVAGPIERASNLMGQFGEVHAPTYENFSQGGRLMLWGMAKKVLIADNLAMYVDAVYKSPGAFGGTATYIAVIFFAIQIYCDFSGYPTSPSARRRSWASG